MELIYIGHSGFAVLGEGFTIVIDYYRDPADVHSFLLTRPGAFYVLSSHVHADHFNPEVLSWKTIRPDILYLFSKDILESRRAVEREAVFLEKGDVYQDDLIRVKAFGSTDAGISFLINMAEKRIFHAGDLNNWHWKEESTLAESRQAEADFKAELEEVVSEASSVDLAMFPVDPRLGKEYMLGAEQFVDRIKTDVFVPMHFDQAYGRAAAFGTYAKVRGIRFVAWTKEGERIDF
ncbi:MBL fold metallo-hydrolase [Sanguibacteroides sp. AM78-02pH3A]|uniref:MBL fold metallo-hydrolase n=1 Tax=Sanguibacteroides sp. AM78-02pH3A TaxID=3002646 RepID=UPI0022E1D9CC|nr:MBL fold metallo-hydrolase [Sanguibacteroides sp. AM78-02pH3A]